MTKLHALEPEPLGTGIVEMLEGILEQAKAGELSSIAVAKVYRSGCIGGEWSWAPSTGMLIGSLSRLQYRLNEQSCDE